MLLQPKYEIFGMILDFAKIVNSQYVIPQHLECTVAVILNVFKYVMGNATLERVLFLVEIQFRNAGVQESQNGFVAGYRVSQVLGKFSLWIKFVTTQNESRDWHMTPMNQRLIVAKKASKQVVW